MTRDIYSRRPSRRAPRHQRGMVLVFSLVILLVLTILGVTTMRTSAVEQIMSGSTQEAMRAFQAANSGLDKALDQIKSGTPADPGMFVNNTLYSYTSMNASSKAKTPQLLQIGPPVRSTKGTGYGTAARAYYSQQVVASTPGNAYTTLSQGITTGAPSNPYSP
jgi:Tfp pilus assembly protein PilX